MSSGRHYSTDYDIMDKRIDYYNYILYTMECREGLYLQRHLKFSKEPKKVLTINKGGVIIK